MKDTYCKECGCKFRECDKIELCQTLYECHICGYPEVIEKAN